MCFEKLEDRLKANQFQGEEEALAIRRNEERRRREAEAGEVQANVAPATVAQRSLFEEGDAGESD